MKTQVSITVDVEFNVGGAFEYPGKYAPIGDRVVNLVADGKENGIGFIIETLKKYGVRGTFFVEVLNRCYFGDAPMRSIVDRLAAAGQDVQLHVHPVWLRFLPSGHGFAQHDSCVRRDIDELRRVFSIAVDAFVNWVGVRPVAVRTGNLEVSNAVFQVAAEHEIPLSSSIGIGVHEPSEAALQVTGGRHVFHGVMEVPVLSYRDIRVSGRRVFRCLQITSCSWPEMRRILLAAHAQGVTNVVVLTHAFEYAKANNFRYERITRNRVNQSRLIRLCDFISRNSDKFEGRAFGSSAQEWLCSGISPQPDVSMPVPLIAARMIQNKINDVVWRY